MSHKSCSCCCNTCCRPCCTPCCKPCCTPCCNPCGCNSGFGQGGFGNNCGFGGIGSIAILLLLFGCVGR